MKLLTIFVILFSNGINARERKYNPDLEHNITSIMLSGYNKAIQPGNLTIQLKLTLNQIVSIDEKNQILTTSSLVDLTWTDTRLSFDPKKGMSEVLAPASSVWLPDMYVINTADSNGFFTIYPENLAVITSMGNVKVTVSLTGLRTRCELNYYKFPFDVQNCEIRIGSWQHTSDRFDFDSDDGYIDTAQMIPNSVFGLTNASVFDRESSSRFGANQNGTDVVYSFTLERESRNYMINNVVPVFLISGINLLMFNFRYPSQCTMSKLFKVLMQWRVLGPLIIINK